MFLFGGGGGGIDAGATLWGVFGGSDGGTEGVLRLGGGGGTGPRLGGGTGAELFRSPKKGGGTPHLVVSLAAVSSSTGVFGGRGGGGGPGFDADVARSLP